MYQEKDLFRISKDIGDLIQEGLLRAGIFYRIFIRCKSAGSIEKKIHLKSYDGETKFLQDIIGIRINLYFADDLEIAFDYLSRLYSPSLVNQTVDKRTETEFKPNRINITLKIPNQFIKEFRDIIHDNRIDLTFEIQLRTILSEGWHEVDHDLRYKCQNDWSDHSDLSRYFNGILAALETSDLSMINMFDQISRRHYKNGNLDAMLRTRLRLRFIDGELSSKLKSIILADPELAKQLFKIDRKEFIMKILLENYKFPCTMTNYVLLINHFYLKNPFITSLAPDNLDDLFK